MPVSIFVSFSVHLPPLTLTARFPSGRGQRPPLLCCWYRLLYSNESHWHMWTLQRSLYFNNTRNVNHDIYHMDIKFLLRLPSPKEIQPPTRQVRALPHRQFHEGCNRGQKLVASSLDDWKPTKSRLQWTRNLINILGIQSWKLKCWMGTKITLCITTHWLKARSHWPINTKRMQRGHQSFGVGIIRFHPL